MTITAPTTVTVTGLTASSTAGNIRLDATIAASDGSGTTENAANPQSFSVVSVTLSLQTAGGVPSQYPDLLGLPSTTLGAQIYPPGTGNWTGIGQWVCTAPYFVTGTVTPSNYPGNVTLRRSKVYDLYTDPSNTPVSSGTGDDTSPGSYLANTPSANSGYIYDWDSPGIRETDGVVSTGEVDRARQNFTEYAVLGNSSSTNTVGNSLSIYSRVSCAKLATGVQFDTTFSGDNSAGQGTTNLTRTLQ